MCQLETPEDDSLWTDSSGQPFTLQTPAVYQCTGKLCVSLEHRRVTPDHTRQSVRMQTPAVHVYTGIKLCVGDRKLKSNHSLCQPCACYDCT